MYSMLPVPRMNLPYEWVKHDEHLWYGVTISKHHAEELFRTFEYAHRGEKERAVGVKVVREGANTHKFHISITYFVPFRVFSMTDISPLLVVQKKIYDPYHEVEYLHQERN